MKKKLRNSQKNISKSVGIKKNWRNMIRPCFNDPLRLWQQKLIAEARESIRFTFGWNSTSGEAVDAAAIVSDLVGVLR